jgi:hypothetical protein
MIVLYKMSNIIKSLRCLTIHTMYIIKSVLKTVSRMISTSISVSTSDLIYSLAINLHPSFYNAYLMDSYIGKIILKIKKYASANK